MTSQKQSQLTNEILQGNLIKLMFKLSTPGILGTLLLSSSTFIDALFAGQLIGETAVAGISLASPLTSVILGSAYLVGIGSASVLSRAIGSGDIKTQSKIFGNLIIISIIISLVLTIIGYSFGEELIVFMGGSGEVASNGAKFFKTYMLGSVFCIIAIAANHLIKSEGKLRLTMIFAAIFVIVNIILNTIFIKIFNWGIQGLAFATVIAMLVYCIAILTYFISGKSSIPVHPLKLVIAIDLLPEILSVGISELLTPIMSLIQSFVVFKSISHYGTQNDIAFFGATETLSLLAFIPLNGFMQAFQPVIGINYGAKNYHRLKKAYLTFVVGVIALLILFWLPMQLFPKTFLGLLLPKVTFTIDDFIYFWILNLVIPLMPVIACSVVLFQSIGKGKVVGIIVILRSLILFIPMVIILSRFFGLGGIYYGIVLTDVIILLIAIKLTLQEFNYFSKMETKTL
ncbi:MATE family efflux transporter [Nostoc sp. PA-18-2419]|uniref:MATE family efflux transporter n=1 Tax=Nostoc sp. PA-18-2419 TaxID=2575443 RepID=UPI00110952D5|nr:MATE family efflux transporter [Nostoc sp. PA-18-2419]